MTLCLQRNRRLFCSPWINPTCVILLTEILHPILLVQSLLSNWFSIHRIRSSIPHTCKLLLLFTPLLCRFKHVELWWWLRGWIYCLVVLNWVAAPFLVILVLFGLRRSSRLSWWQGLRWWHLLWLRLLHLLNSRLIWNLSGLRHICCWYTAIVFLILVIILHHLIKHSLLCSWNFLITTIW